MENAFDPHARLQTKKGICAYLGNISSATYDLWHARGIVPGPVPGTTRYDVRQHDAALDRQSGMTAQRARSTAYDDWKASHAR